MDEMTETLRHLLPAVCGATVSAWLTVSLLSQVLVSQRESPLQAGSWPTTRDTFIHLEAVIHG